MKLVFVYETQKISEQHRKNNVAPKPDMFISFIILFSNVDFFVVVLKKSVKSI